MDDHANDVANSTDEELLSLRALIETELNRREQVWRKRLNALQLARGTAKPMRQRATRSDKGKPKTPRALVMHTAEFPNGEPDPRVEIVTTDEDFADNGGGRLPHE